MHKKWSRVAVVDMISDVFLSSLRTWIGFPCSSAGKESACNAGDPSWIPGSGRSPRERIGYPLQFSWASLVAETTKNPPAMWVTWVQSLGREDPLEKGMATHSSILAWRIPWREESGRLESMGWQRVRHNLVTEQQQQKGVEPLEKLIPSANF